MSNPARKRLMVESQDNNIFLWKAVIFGPDDTPWDGGTNHQLFVLVLGCFTLISFLCDPNPNSSVNSEAARLFSENKREYNRWIEEIAEQSWTAD